MTKIVEKFNIQQAVSKFRQDIVIANPVSFLVRAMSGEEFEGEKLNLRERVEVAKFLGARIVPTVAPEERGIGTAAPVTPPPLTIVLHAPASELKGAGVDIMEVVGETKVDNKE